MSRQAAISLTATLLLLMTLLPIPSSAKPSNFENFSKLGCRGTYSSSLFDQLEMVCEDCEGLFIEREEVGRLCRNECFSSAYFPSCLQALQRHDEQREFRAKVATLGGKTFDVLPK